MSSRDYQYVGGPDSPTHIPRLPNPMTLNSVSRVQAEGQHYRSFQCQEIVDSCLQPVAHFFEQPGRDVFIFTKEFEQPKMKRKA
jgi:hypothetical protein